MIRSDSLKLRVLKASLPSLFLGICTYILAAMATGFNRGDDVVLWLILGTIVFGYLLSSVGGGKNIFARMLKYFAYMCWLSPVFAIIYTFVSASQVAQSTGSDSEKGFAVVGIGIGGAFIVILFLIGGGLVGLVCFLIGNSIAKKSAQTEAYSLSDSKKCEFCAETIKLEAKVCKHCGREQTQIAQDGTAESEGAPRTRGDGKKVDIKKVATIVVVVVLSWFVLTTLSNLATSLLNANSTTSSNPSVSSSEAGTVTLASTKSESDFPSDGVDGQSIVLENSVMSVTVANRGAVITGITLKKGSDQVSEISPFAPKENIAFQTSFGGPNAEPIESNFEVSQLGPLIWKFSRTYNDLSNEMFTFTKTYTLRPDEYLVKIEVSFASATGAVPKLNEPFAYSLALYPKVASKGSSVGYPRFYSFDGNSRIRIPNSVGTSAISGSRLWSALDYGDFAVFAITDSTSYEATFFRDPTREASALVFSRPSLNSSTVTDTFHYYVGPKSETQLKKYNTEATNGFGLFGLHMEKISSGIPFMD